MDLTKDNVRNILSETLKLLSTPEYQTQLEKSRPTAQNNAVTLLQITLPIISRAQQQALSANGLPGQQAILDFNLKVRQFEQQDPQIGQMSSEIRSYILPALQ